MADFTLDSLEDWHNVSPGEMLHFESAGDSRRVKLDVISNAPCEVWADARLVGFGEGQFSIRFTVLGDVDVQFLAPTDAAIFVRGSAPDQRISVSEQPSYTTIAPRERRNTDFDRMMMWVRMNEENRNAQMAEQIALLQAQYQAQHQQAPAPSTQPQSEEGTNEQPAQ